MKTIPVRHLAEKERGLPERFSIRDIKELAGEKDLMQDLHRHDFFFILALQKGSGVHQIDFRSYDITDGSVFFMRPGQVHQLLLEKGTAGYLMEFNKEFCYQGSQRLRKAGSNNHYLPDAAAFEKLYSILQSILEEYSLKQDGYHEAIKANLDLLFISLGRLSEIVQSTAKDTDRYMQSRLQEFTELLELHITSIKQASQYAGLMSLSLYQLNNITKSSLGKTATEMITDHLILEAKRYLLATANQVKDIAWELGYEDTSYFIRLFKKHTGHAPEAFRNNFK
jgi:AraC family transcriptional activator of pobA